MMAPRQLVGVGTTTNPKNTAAYWKKATKQPHPTHTTKKVANHLICDP
jgi:hypothetical protein